MTTDVAETTEARTETEAAPAADTEALSRGTDERTQERQTDTSTEGNEATEGSAPDPRAARVSALADAERQEAIEEGKRLALEEVQGTSTQQQRAAARNKLKSAFPQAQAKIDSIFNAAKDEYGDSRPLTAFEATEVKNALAGYNLTAWDAASEDVADVVREIAYGKLPTKEAQAAFTAATADDTSLPQYLDAWAEHAALHTKAVKGMDLAAAMKASNKVKREVEAAKLAAYDEGRDQGRLDPAGTSPDGGRTTQRQAPGSKSYNQLEEGYGSGSLTRAEEAQYIQMRDARKKS